MEWAVLVGFALLAAALIGIPRSGERDEATEAAIDLAALREERQGLIEELRELDDDTQAGRISADDRLAGRRAIAPRLREVTDELRALGADLAAPEEAPAAAESPRAAVPEEQHA